MGDPHLRERQLASYLDRALDPAEQSAIEVHLESCDDCRAELRAAAQLTTTVPVFRRRWLVAAAAAAAAVALVVFAPGRKPANEVVRGPSEGEGVSRVQVVTPIQGSRLPRPSLQLTWHPARGAELYRVTLTDAGGATLWTDSTSDTTVTPGARLEPGRTYYWVVDALLADGRSATTGNVGFSVTP